MFKWLRDRMKSSLKGELGDSIFGVSKKDAPHTAGMLAIALGSTSSPQAKQTFEVQIALYGESLPAGSARIKSAIITTANYLTVRALASLKRSIPGPDDSIPDDFHIILGFNNFLLGTLRFAAGAEGQDSCSLEELVRDASTLLLARKSSEAVEQQTGDGYEFFCTIRAQRGAAEDRWRNAVVQQCRYRLLQAISNDPCHHDLDFDGALSRLLGSLLETTSSIT